MDDRIDNSSQKEIAEEEQGLVVIINPEQSHRGDSCSPKNGGIAMNPALELKQHKNRGKDF